MKGDIALAGFVMTEDEWKDLDAPSRALLLAVALRRDDPWLAAAPSDVPLAALTDAAKDDDDVVVIVETFRRDEAA
jgi:hypothetical protein